MEIGKWSSSKAGRQKKIPGTRFKTKKEAGNFPGFRPSRIRAPHTHGVDPLGNYNFFEPSEAKEKQQEKQKKILENNELILLVEISKNYPPVIIRIGGE